MTCEVCVMGGGPAGAATALRLAQLGHDVMLVERAARGRPHVGESLTPGVLPVLDMLGVRRAVEDAGFLRPRGARVDWNAGATDRADLAGAPGFQVDRGRFDALLLEAAEAAGVRVLHGVHAHEPGRHDGAWHVPLRGGGGDGVRAHVVIDARGRRAAPAVGVATTALCAYWPRAAGVVPTDGRSVVEAGADCWFWAAPLPDGRLHAAVFIAAAQAGGLDARQRAELYRHRLAASRLLAPMLAGREPGPVQACDATSRVCDEPAHPEGLLRVGEAAFSIDPLSSQGVAAALRSGVQAAACVHTLRARPGDTALALGFHRAQVRRASQRHARLAANFHVAAAARFGSTFWTDAARTPAAITAASAWRPLPMLDTTVRLDAALRWCRTGVLEGDWIVEREAIEHPGLDAPVGFLGRHAVGACLAPLQSPRRVDELLSLWQSWHGAAEAPRLLAQLWRQGLLVSAAGA